MKITQIKKNPNNPRVIRDDKFRKLCKSITDFPEMMELRPIIVDENNIVQGGNMRYKALQELGYKDIPDEWVKQGKDLTPEQWQEFVIKDNVGFGEWDYDILSTDWDSDKLVEWGLDDCDFKKQIVALYKSGKQVSKLSREYDVATPTIYKWIKESDTTGSFRMQDNLTDEQKELIELRKRNAQLEMENDILKQAALIMGRKSKS